MPGNYCPQCTHFVSLEFEDDIETDDVILTPDDEGNGNITGSVRLVLTCAECSDEMKEATPDVDIYFQHDCIDDPNPVEGYEDTDDQFELGEVTAEHFTRLQTHDRHGKELKGPMRYRKSCYGADISAEILCNKCGDEFTVTSDDDCRVEEQAGYFDELN